MAVPRGLRERGCVLGLQASVRGLCCGGLRTRTGLGPTARCHRTVPPAASAGGARDAAGRQPRVCQRGLRLCQSAHSRGKSGTCGGRGTRQGGDRSVPAWEGRLEPPSQRWARLRFGTGLRAPTSRAGAQPPGLLSAHTCPQARSSPAEGTANSTRLVTSPEGARRPASPPLCRSPLPDPLSLNPAPWLGGY